MIYLRQAAEVFKVLFIVFVGLTGATLAIWFWLDFMIWLLRIIVARGY